MGGISSAAFPPASQFGGSSVANGNSFVSQPIPAAGKHQPGISMKDRMEICLNVFV